MFGFSGETLIQNAVGNNAIRTTPMEIVSFLSQAQCASAFDIDKNEIMHVFTDGILIMRYLFGFTGTSLVENVIGAGARYSDDTEILSRLDALRR
jgi:hypothetical protein